MWLIDRVSGHFFGSGAFFNRTRWAAVLGSLLLTFLAVSQDHMPNDDGVLYLLSAELFAAGSWDEALRLYNWPFYGILIAGVHLLSGLGFEASAHVLNGLLQAALVFVFLSVVSELGGDRKIVLAASVLILIFPNFNEYRSEIIRDHGYWAFAMLGLLFLLKHFRQSKAVYQIGWVAALTLSGLFRIEGLVLVALAPLIFLLDPRVTMLLRGKRLALIYGWYAAVTGLVFVVAVSSGIEGASLKLWDKPVHMLTQFYSAVSSDLSQKVAVLRQGFLVPYSDEYAWPIAVTAIVIILVTEIVASIGFVFGFLAVYAWLRAEAFRGRYQWRIVWFFAAVNVLMLAAFVVSLGFLTGRYPIALALLLMLFSSFGLVALYHRLTGKGSDVAARRKRAGVAFAFVALVLFVDGVFSFSPGKVHVEKAAAWLNDYTHPTDRVFSLDAPLLYRSGKLEWKSYLEHRERRHSGRSIREVKELTLGDMLETMDWRQFDYIAALVSRKTPDQQKDIEKIILSVPVKEFRNRKGDRVLIYATKAEAAKRLG